MNPLLIVKTGTTLESLRGEHGDFEDWIGAGMQIEPNEIAVASVFENGQLPDPARFAGVVVTGSSAMVSHRESWSERSAEWLRGVVSRGVPVLGICFGHQLLAHALGGRVAPNPRGRQIGTVPLQLDAAAARDDLFAAVGGSFPVHVTHSEAVIELPRDAVRLASTQGDPNSAFSFGAAAWGVQFHPEFDARVMRGYIEARRVQLLAENIDADARLASVRECPDAPRLLLRFRELLADGRGA
jgi:GMP synthase (glutamine-hydrolysing)